MPQLKPLSNTPPVEALRFAADFEFGEGDADALAPIPITVKARSNQPIEHWYWGRIVHDMAGMFTNKPIIVFDYCHDPGQILGPCDKQEASDEGLLCAGSLVPVKPGDRAYEIKKLGGEHKVPYEASIDWTGEGILIEQVGEGAVSQVNGYTFEGPGVIVRKWPLRGVAICPYGADEHTETLFKADGPTVPVTYLSQETAMPTTKKLSATPAPATTEAPATTPAAAPAATATPAAGATATVEGEADDEESAETSEVTAPAGTTELTASQKEGQRYVTAFGSQGALWYLEGKTFDDAQKLFAQGQQQQLSALQDENTQLKKTVTALRGEGNPLTFSNADPAPPATQFVADDNYSKVAKAIKLPK